MNDHADPEQNFLAAERDLRRLVDGLGGVIVGQQALVEHLVVALFAGGHVLIEGLPGLGKTHLVKALAALLGHRLARIQCTPDLMPADVVGADTLVTGADGSSVLEFRPGPVFASLVLIDEINRATPRSQSALLEAMQERQVTYGGRRYPLPDPFWVVATQNPIELEGTYPLPEAQLDRFLFKLTVPFPDVDTLRALIDVSLDEEPADTLQPAVDGSGANRIITAGRDVQFSGPVIDAAVALVQATQPGSARPSSPAGQLRYGASPRGLQALLRSARVAALLRGRVQVDFDDLRGVALPALRHRVLLSVEAELEGLTPDAILTDLVSDCLPDA